MQHEGLWLSNFSAHQNHLEVLLDFWVPLSKGPGKGLRLCASNEFLGDADAAMEGLNFENHCPEMSQNHGF